jgi:hypothetical protein
MTERHRVKQAETLQERLAAEAKRLREEASLLPEGALREAVLRKALEVEAGSQMTEWLRSPGSTSPD